MPPQDDMLALLIRAAVELTGFTLIVVGATVWITRALHRLEIRIVKIESTLQNEQRNQTTTDVDASSIGIHYPAE